MADPTPVEDLERLRAAEIAFREIRRAYVMAEIEPDDEEAGWKVYTEARSELAYASCGTVAALLDDRDRLRKALNVETPGLRDSFIEEFMERCANDEELFDAGGLAICAELIARRKAARGYDTRRAGTVPLGDDE